MKKVMIMLLGAFLCISTYAQTVNISLRGSNQNRLYRILVDGAVYNSEDAVSTNNGNGVGAQKTIVLNNLAPGSHSIAVYDRTNATGNQNGPLVYSNNFQLRPDYDMFIAVNGARISFSEKLAVNASIGTGIGTPMGAADFAQLLQEIKNNRYQSSRAAAIREAVSSTDMYTVNQLRQLLNLVTSEATKLELVKSAYASVTDPGNYARLSNLFTTQANRTQLNNFIQTQVNGSVTVDNTGVNTTTRTLLSAYQFDQLLQTLNANNYQSGKFNIIRDAFSKTTNAFTTAQIRQMLGSITSEPDRLYLAKLAYSTVSDPVNFSTLLTVFSTQSNRTELNNYIISNGGTGGTVYVQTRTPMADAAFTALLREAGDHILPWDKVKDVKAAFIDPQNNFTSAQARQLIYLVSSGNLLAVSESSRVELAKLSYARITDPVNFSQVIDLFTTQASRDDIESYIRLQVQNN